jgi:hypothetical protein
MSAQLKTESLTHLTRKGTCIEFFSAYQEMDIERMMGLCNPQGEVVQAARRGRPGYPRGIGPQPLAAADGLLS